MSAVHSLLAERKTLAMNIAAQIAQFRAMDERLTAATAEDPAISPKAVMAEIDAQDDLIITALTGIEGAPAGSGCFRQGQLKGREDCQRGHYLPTGNPYPLGTQDELDWRAGYVGAWDATYFAKRQKKEVAHHGS